MQFGRLHFGIASSQFVTENHAKLGEEIDGTVRTGTIYCKKTTKSLCHSQGQIWIEFYRPWDTTRCGNVLHKSDNVTYFD